MVRIPPAAHCREHTHPSREVATDRQRLLPSPDLAGVNPVRDLPLHGRRGTNPPSLSFLFLRLKMAIPCKFQANKIVTVLIEGMCALVDSEQTTVNTNISDSKVLKGISLLHSSILD